MPAETGPIRRAFGKDSLPGHRSYIADSRWRTEFILPLCWRPKIRQEVARFSRSCQAVSRRVSAVKETWTGGKRPSVLFTKLKGTFAVNISLVQMMFDAGLMSRPLCWRSWFFLSVPGVSLS